MSTKEINHHLKSHPSIEQALAKDFEASVKRGKIIATAAVAAVVAIKVANFVAEKKVYNASIQAMADTIGNFYE